MQTAANETENDPWPQIAPLLDAAMAGLNETDRHAVVLRYFDGKSMKEVGTALGASEDSAKMRVSRAVEKLRAFFTKRGVVIPAAVLTAAVAANSVQAAPAALAKTATTIAIAKGTTASASTSALIKGSLKLDRVDECENRGRDRRGDPGGGHDRDAQWSNRNHRPARRFPVHLGLLPATAIQSPL